MKVEQQQVGMYRQLDLFEQLISQGHGATGKGGTGTGACEERQAFTASNEGRALAQEANI